MKSVAHLPSVIAAAEFMKTKRLLGDHPELKSLLQQELEAKALIRLQDHIDGSLTNKLEIERNPKLPWIRQLPKLRTIVTSMLSRTGENDANLQYIKRWLDGRLIEWGRK